MGTGMIELIFLTLAFAFVIMAILAALAFTYRSDDGQSDGQKMVEGSVAAFGAIYLGGVRREMSFPSIRRLALCVAALSLAAGFGGCAEGGTKPAWGPGVAAAWTAPGWYLEKPYLLVLGGPKYFGGPFSYDECEEQRIRLPKETATDMLCIRENRRPEVYGAY
jgi:hypothetical protein